MTQDNSERQKDDINVDADQHPCEALSNFDTATGHILGRMWQGTIRGTGSPHLTLPKL